MTLTVAVLMGGPSPEREVSLSTGRMIVESLDQSRYGVLPIEISAEGRWLPRPEWVPLPAEGDPAGAAPATVARDLAPSGAESLRGQVHVAFIAMHGPYGEDGTIQGLLEIAGVPYTGSRVLASALCMDKLRSRQVLAYHGIPTPRYAVIDEPLWRAARAVQRGRALGAIGLPCVVKPNAVGSSIGVSLVRDADAFDRAVEEALRYGSVVLVEEEIRGTEITCGVLEDPETGEPWALPVIEIVPAREFYTYDAKYAPGGSAHVIPARIPPGVAERAARLAVAAHRSLGCEGMSRADMFARGEEVIVLEVNTIPGMTRTSLLPEAARAAGIEFPELLDRIVRSALHSDAARRVAAPPPPPPGTAGRV